jgi:hypothetical protein
MGTLRSFTDWSHRMSVNDVELGDPVELDGDLATFEWDHGALPNGWIDANGNIVVETQDTKQEATAQPDEPVTSEPKRRLRRKKSE